MKSRNCNCPQEICQHNEPGEAPTNVTDKEFQVMRGIIMSEYNGAAPDRCDPIWSWSISSHCTLPKRSLGALVASLVKKGYAVATAGDTKDEDTVVLTDAGVAEFHELNASKPCPVCQDTACEIKSFACGR